MTTRILKLAALLATPLAAAACAGYGDDASGASFDGDFGGETGGGAGRDDGGGGGGGGGEFEPPEETYALTGPTPSRDFVFIANTTRGTLAKVALSGDAIQITTVRVGALPEIVRTHPIENTAVVLNTGSDSVSIVRAAPIGEDDEVLTLDIVPACNRLELSPAGELAFAWYDNRVAEPGDIPGSLSELSVIDLTEGSEVVHQLSVGVNIRDVVYDETGETAFIITDEGVSPIAIADIDGDRFVPPIRLDEDAVGTVGTDREVLVTGDGTLAVVRTAADTTLRVVELDGGAARELEFDIAPSDVDLVPGENAVLVSLRGESAVALVDLDDLVSGELAPVSEFIVDTHPVSASVISDEGTNALLWANHSADEVPFVTWLTLDGRDLQTFNVRKGVRFAELAPGGGVALVVHTKQPGEPVAGEPEADIIAKSHGFTALDLDRGVVRLVRTPATPSEIAFTEDGGHAFVLTADQATAARSVVWTDLTTFQTEQLDFDRLPEHVGVVPGAGVVYVSQIHELGRIAFIDVETGEIREITGFELNGLIE